MKNMIPCPRCGRKGIQTEGMPFQHAAEYFCAKEHLVRTEAKSPLRPVIEPYRYPTIPWDQEKTRALSEPKQVVQVEEPPALPENWDHFRYEALKRDRYRCLRCGGPKALTGHHIIPRAHGGRDALWNLMTLCDKCHNYVEPEQTFRPKGK